jgi:hypothetical protein
MATTSTYTSASAAIRGMNANAVNSMKHGMNQKAVGQLKQAMGCLTTYLEREEMNIIRETSLRMKQTGNLSSYPHQGSVVPSATASSGPLSSDTPLHFPSTCISGDTTPRAQPHQDSCTSTSSSTLIPHHPCTQERSSYIYDRAFLFPPHSSGCEGTLYGYRTQAIAVLLYNTALAYHRSGIESGKSAELWHAAATYNLIPSMLGQEGLQNYPEMVVLILGLISNLAHIHLEFREEPGLQSALAILQDLILRVPYESMPQEDYAFFQLHLICLQRESFSYAPAA